MGLQLLRRRTGWQKATDESPAICCGRRPSLPARYFVMVIILFSLGRICLGDALTGTYQGSMTPQISGTRFPGISLTFQSDGTFIWALHDSWSSFLSNGWITFPAINGNGTYHYDASNGELSLNSFWNEIVESSEVAGYYCSKYFMYTLNNSMSASSDAKSLYGQIYCNFTFVSFAAGSETSQELFNCSLKKVEPRPPDNAQCLGNTIPATLGVSESVDVTITMSNAGEVAWQANDDYCLSVIQNVGGIDISPRTLIAPDVTVEPGESYTFEAHLTAPATPALCELKFRMEQESVGVFGDIEIVSINVGNYTAVRDWLLYQ